MNVLEHNVGCALVYYDPDILLSIWWNGSLTFNVWCDDKNTDCFTRTEAPEDMYEAKQIAADWIACNDPMQDL